MENEFQKKQIENIYNIIRDVLKDWWVALFIAISFSMLSYIFASVTYHPTYTSSTTFVVSAKGSTTGIYANISKTNKLTSTFRSVLDSQILKKKVSESLEMESFPGTISIYVVPETNLLTVSVTSDSPEISFRLLKGILDNYQIVSANVLGEVVMEIFEEPNYPSYPNRSFQGESMMKKAFLYAGIAMVCVLGFVSYLKDTVKSEEEITEKLDTNVFGVLKYEPAYRSLKAFWNRHRKKLLITEPAVSFGYVENIKKMRTRLFYQNGEGKAKVLLVTSALSREGKTTIAANLALAIAQAEKKVLLIDGNLNQGALEELLGVEKKGEGTPELAKQVIQTKYTSLYLWANHDRKIKSAEFLASKRFVEFLNQMREEMDFIIIDGPAAIGNADAEILARRSDFSLLIVKQNDAKVSNINDTIDMLNGYGKGVLGCVLNNVFHPGTVPGYGRGYGYGYGKYHYGKYGSYYRHYNRSLQKDVKKEE